ncbi:hypothetical protein GOP47_0000050 [Adiantum capillus-veneris]|uniref:Uncharacterized protein n=1 Tax=Adiantum capillus-veneris TaxID=13818 RepID=A0A9D4VCA9_ADICA|nr:hypothetical protein GOP47_0000050 [Adiantum capillus-veneris]
MEVQNQLDDDLQIFENFLKSSKTPDGSHPDSNLEQRHVNDLKSHPQELMLVELSVPHLHEARSELQHDLVTSFSLERAHMAGDEVNHFPNLSKIVETNMFLGLKGSMMTRHDIYGIMFNYENLKYRSNIFNM